MVYITKVRDLKNTVRKHRLDSRNPFGFRGCIIDRYVNVKLVCVQVPEPYGNIRPGFEFD